MTAIAETVQVDDVFDLFSEIYDQEKREDFSLQEYLEACAEDPTFYAGVAERMIAAIGAAWSMIKITAVDHSRILDNPIAIPNPTPKTAANTSPSPSG